MAGEPSLYLVYQAFSTAERIGVSWHGTQAAADDAATDAGAGFTARSAHAPGGRSGAHPDCQRHAAVARRAGRDVETR